MDPRVAHALRTLELQPGATDEDLTRAWRGAAMRHHPDLGGSDDRFRAAREAYETLIELGSGSFEIQDAGPRTAQRDRARASSLLGGPASLVKAPVSPGYYVEQQHLEAVYGSRGVWNRCGLHGILRGAHIKRERKG